MFRYLILVIWLLASWTVTAQKHYRIMFYNVENLFDTYDDPLTKDDEFTPFGVKHWTKNRYMIKMRQLAEVMDSVGSGEWPLVIGLAEVENRRVLEDLTTKTVLADGGYGIVHQDSPDRRGIDVAMLFRKDCLDVQKVDFLTIPFPEDTTIRTRDILYAETVLGHRDTLHFFVCLSLR